MIHIQMGLFALCNSSLLGCLIHLQDAETKELKSTYLFLFTDLLLVTVCSFALDFIVH